MIGLLFAQSARVLAGEPGFDHIADVAVVARFLAEAERSDVSIDGVELLNRDVPDANAMTDFLVYARDCSIEDISVVASADRRLPVGVTWDCGRYIEKDGERYFEERTASFWVTQGQISKIAFGKPPVIKIQELRERVQQRLRERDQPNG